MSGGLFRGIDDSLDGAEAGQGFERLDDEWARIESGLDSGASPPDNPPPTFENAQTSPEGAAIPDASDPAAPGSPGDTEAAEFVLVDENEPDQANAEPPVARDLIAPHMASAPSGRVLYEFGPFSAFARKLEAEIPKLAEGDPHEEAFANLYLSTVRELLNNAFIDMPGASDDGVAGMSERQGVLELFDKNLNEFHVKLKQQYGDQHLQYALQYRTAVGSLLRVEHQKIETLKESLANVTPGKVVAGLVNMGVAKLFGSSNPELSGRLRQARERAIDQQLKSLDKAATEMAHGNRVGNAEWEQAEGAEYVREAESALKETQDLMKKIMKQTDDRGFLKRFQTIQSKFDDLHNRAATDKMRTALSGLCAGIRQFVTKVLAKVGFIVDKDSKNTAGGKAASFGA